MNLVFLGVLTASASSAPVLPARCTDELYRLNYEIQRALLAGEFQRARELLQQWTYGEAKYFLESPLPVNAQGADADAAKVWEDVTGNRIRFIPARNQDEQGILVRLKPVSGSVVEVRLPYWEKGCVIAEIPVEWGPLKQSLSRTSVARAIARAFGFAVGLAPTKHSTGVMVSHLLAGPQPLTLGGVELNANLFTELERERISQVLRAREELEKLVREEQKITPAVPRLEVFPKTADVGYVRTGQVPRYEFRLKNIGNATLFIVPEVGCGCILLDSMEKIAPGEEIVVTAAMDTKDLVGKISKDIIFHANDPVEPHQAVIISATSTPEYRIVPESTEFIVLSDEGETKWELYFCIMTETSIKLLSVIPGDPRINVKLEPWAGEIVDPPFGEKPVRRMGYRITLTFSANIEAGSHWFDLHLKTDSLFMPNKTINIQAQKGVFFIPRGFYYGGVEVQPGAVRAVTLLHPSKPFKILSVRVEGEGFDVNYEPLTPTPEVAECKQYLLKAVYKGGLKGTIHAVVVVTTDHPRYPVIRIPITGSILEG